MGNYSVEKKLGASEANVLTGLEKRSIVFVPLIKGVAERFVVPASQITFEEFRERKRAHRNRIHFKLEGVH